MTLFDSKPLHRNTLRGTAVVQLRSGLLINGFTVHESGPSSWVGMPTCPIFWPDDEAWREASGNWQACDAFSAAVLALILAQLPDALRHDR